MVRINIDEGPHSVDWWTLVIYMDIWTQAAWVRGLHHLAHQHGIIIGPGLQIKLLAILTHLYGGYMPYIRLAQTMVTREMVNQAVIAARYL